MLTLLVTMTIMFAGVGIMYMTDNNRKKYTDYQIKKIIAKSQFADLL